VCATATSTDLTAPDRKTVPARPLGDIDEELVGGIRGLSDQLYRLADAGEEHPEQLVGAAEGAGA
jgi:hypothetical protein